MTPRQVVLQEIESTTAKHVKDLKVLTTALANPITTDPTEIYIWASNTMDSYRHNMVAVSKLITITKD